MAKGEKNNFNSLNGAFSEGAPKVFTEEELLGVIKSPEALVKKSKTEQLQIMGAILRQMEVSEVFRKQVLEEIEKTHHKSNL